MADELTAESAEIASLQGHSEVLPDLSESCRVRQQHERRFRSDYILTSTPHFEMSSMQCCIQTDTLRWCCTLRALAHGAAGEAVLIKGEGSFRICEQHVTFVIYGSYLFCSQY